MNDDDNDDELLFSRLKWYTCIGVYPVLVESRFETPQDFWFIQHEHVCQVIQVKGARGGIGIPQVKVLDFSFTICCHDPMCFLR